MGSGWVLLSCLTMACAAASLLIGGPRKAVTVSASCVLFALSGGSLWLTLGGLRALAAWIAVIGLGFTIALLLKALGRNETHRTAAAFVLVSGCLGTAAWLSA